MIGPSGEEGDGRVGLEERLRAVFEDAGEGGLEVVLPSLVELLLDFDANTYVNSMHPWVDDKGKLIHVDPVESRFFFRLITMRERRWFSSFLWSFMLPVPPRPEEYYRIKLIRKRTQERKRDSFTSSSPSTKLCSKILRSRTTRLVSSSSTIAEVPGRTAVS